MDFKDLYAKSFAQHGPTPQGVGWLDQDVQHRRFHALMDGNQYNVASILDVGCGYGELVEFLYKYRKLWFNHIKYMGIDVVPEMIDIARARHGRAGTCPREFHELDIRGYADDGMYVGGKTYDLVVCSGALAFHDMPEKLDMLDAMWELTGKVLAFNVKDTEVYLRDLAMIMPRFKTSNWRVRHDYGLTDMTVVVKR